MEGRARRRLVYLALHLLKLSQPRLRYRVFILKPRLFGSGFVKRFTHGFVDEFVVSEYHKYQHQYKDQYFFFQGKIPAHKFHF